MKIWIGRIVLTFCASYIYYLGNMGMSFTIIAPILLCIAMWKSPGWWGALSGFVFVFSLYFVLLMGKELDIWIPASFRYPIPILLGMIYCLPCYLFANQSKDGNPIVVSLLFACGWAAIDYLISFTLLGMGTSPAISMDVGAINSGWIIFGSYVFTTFSMFLLGGLSCVILYEAAHRRLAIVWFMVFIAFGFSGLLFVDAPRKEAGGICAQKRFTPEKTSAAIVVLPEGISHFKVAHSVFEATKSKEEVFYASLNKKPLGKMLIECPFGRSESYCLIFEKDGKLAGIYEKNYPMWKSRTKEPEYFTKDTTLGLLGIAICFDSVQMTMFPEYARRGVTVLAWPCYDGFGWPAERQIRLARIWSLSSGMMIVRSAKYKPQVYQGITAIDISAEDSLVPAKINAIGVYVYPYFAWMCLLCFCYNIFTVIKQSRKNL